MYKEKGMLNVNTQEKCIMVEQIMHSEGSNTVPQAPGLRNVV